MCKDMSSARLSHSKGLLVMLCFCLWSFGGVFLSWLVWDFWLGWGTVAQVSAFFFVGTCLGVPALFFWREQKKWDSAPDYQI